MAELQLVPLNWTALPAASTTAQNVDVGHDTEFMLTPGSMRVGEGQLMPLNWTALPASSTAAQNVEVGQDTAFSACPLSTLLGAIQLLPLNWTTLPESSTAAQNVEVAQETAFSACPTSTLVGAVQLVPLNWSAFPEVSTVTQNDTDGHERLTGWPWEGSITCGVAQLSLVPAGAALAGLAVTANPEAVTRRTPPITVAKDFDQDMNVRPLRSDAHGLAHSRPVK